MRFIIELRVYDDHGDYQEDYYVFDRKEECIKFAKEKNVLVGLGRGSAGGSLVSYLLGIIQINPIEFKLLFERFLIDGRMGYMNECKAFKIKCFYVVLKVQKIFLMCLFQSQVRKRT